MANTITNLVENLDDEGDSDVIDLSAATRAVLATTDIFDAKIYLIAFYNNTEIVLPVLDVATGYRKNFISGPGLYALTDPRALPNVFIRVADYADGDITVDMIASNV